MNDLTFVQVVSKKKKAPAQNWIVNRGDYWIGEIEVNHLQFRPRSFELIGPEELRAIAEKIESLKEQ